MTQIPLFRPDAEVEICEGALERAFARVAGGGVYVNGPETERFEAACGDWFGAAHAVAVSSGTMALEIMLRADGLGPHSTVVLTAHTFVAVLEAILAVGAEPRFVDIDPVTWQMPRGEWPSCSVIVSHLYGSVSPAASSIGERIYEDGSQSVGASFNGRRIGTLARAAAISLHPTKNLAAVGDAGVILTQHSELAACVRALRNHGQTAHQLHTYRGTNGRIDEVQAAILCEKLKRLNAFLDSRRKAWRFYREALSTMPLALPSDLPDCIAGPNLFVIRVKNRENFRRSLAAHGIASGVHYPTPLHRMPAYRNARWAAVSLPHTEALCEEIVTLPLWSGIRVEDQERVVSAIAQHLNR